MLTRLFVVLRSELARCCLFGRASVGQVFGFSKSCFVALKASDDVPAGVECFGADRDTSVCLFYNLALDSLHSQLLQSGRFKWITSHQGYIAHTRLVVP